MDLKSETYIDVSRRHPTTYALSHIRRLDLAQSVSAGEKEARNGDSKTDPTVRNQAGEPEGAHPPILFPNLAPV